MKIIFTPGRAILNRLSYPLKFLLIGIIVFIPLFLLGYLQIERHNNEIAFLEQEHKGIDYIKSLRQLIEHIPQHRGMTNGFLKGNSSFREKILAKRREVDERFTALSTIDSQLNSDLETGGTASNLKQQWDTLKTNAFSMTAPESFSAHTDLIDNIIDEIRHVAKTSNLLIDPKFDSSYIVDLLVKRLPLLALQHQVNIPKVTGKKCLF